VDAGKKQSLSDPGDVPSLGSDRSMKRVDRALIDHRRGWIDLVSVFGSKRWGAGRRWETVGPKRPATNCRSSLYAESVRRALLKRGFRHPDRNRALEVEGSF
jgi:hypothetical protein